MNTSEGKKVIATDKAPKAIGPFSQAIQIGSMIFTAGQIGADPGSGKLVPGGVEYQTRQSLINVRYVLEAADSGLEYIVKTTVYLKDMNDFPIMNSVYAEFFANDLPARSTVAVAGLPKGALVEIEAIATLAGEQSASKSYNSL